ncbi:MAG: tRNA preQ1(34) S-adenosylmethionine ribosyltransferase-isomerase QueA [Syntrophomonadaceae bacterium]|jgi:S-adenosylmethionine:tRNA ribosyltransferase-isomerase
MLENKDDVYDLNTYMFDLPPSLIAQYPVEPRDSSRLLVLERKTGHLEDKVFTNIIDYLNKGDTLVINKTKVLPARLFGYKDTGARVEILLLGQKPDGWEVLVKPARRLKKGSIIRFSPESDVEAEIIKELNLAGGRLVRFNNCSDVRGFIEEVGQMPLPPYINRPAEESDKENYQTVYAREAGSAAAPTAGLHFTTSLLEKIQAKGVNLASIVLHVGLGTFRPVSSRDIRQHHMHYEYYELQEATAVLLNKTRRTGNRIIAVGTTVVRTLESVYNDQYGFSASHGETNKFIYPGYELKAVDGLVTNFHLPGSSLIMLVSAFAGVDQIMTAYQHAIANQYRFFSYGDAMLII